MFPPFMLIEYDHAAKLAQAAGSIACHNESRRKRNFDAGVCKASEANCPVMLGLFRMRMPRLKNADLHTETVAFKFKKPPSRRVTKSDLVKDLDAVQAEVDRFLKPLGFKKKGRTHNRPALDGMIHVVNFQMGPFPIGEYVVPGLRESLYGKFCINLGVFLPCVHKVEWRHAIPKFLDEADCTIRARLSSLAFGNDEWFDIPAEPSALSQKIVSLMDEFGLPFLEQFSSYADVLAYYDAHGKYPEMNEGRTTLEIAIICHERGDKEKAATLFAKAHAHAADHKGFREYVRSIAKRLGYSLK